MIPKSEKYLCENATQMKIHKQSLPRMFLFVIFPALVLFTKFVTDFPRLRGGSQNADIASYPMNFFIEIGCFFFGELKVK